ncbi:hypothetical protein AAG589_16515 [Isoptericola sp. F-RaC21]|uniref:hypothetical protein n=1 Tax=Isoptericola sp. F-RaC21 TaxID=3141452 RepID=UPI00315B4536
MDELPPQVLVGLVTLAVIVLVRLRARPVRVRRLVVGPCVVVLVGAFLLVPWVAAGTGSVGATVVVALADLVLTVGLGVARGATVQVERGAAGRVEYRYTGLTVVLWVVSVALRFSLAGAGARLDAAPAVTEGSVLLALGISLLVQNLVVARAARARQPLTEPSITPDTKNLWTKG